MQEMIAFGAKEYIPGSSIDFMESDNYFGTGDPLEVACFKRWDVLLEFHFMALGRNICMSTEIPQGS